MKYMEYTENIECTESKGNIPEKYSERKEEKKGRLKDLIIKLKEEWPNTMQGLLAELAVLEKRARFERDTFAVETIIEEEIEKFDVKKCLLVLAGTLDFENPDFSLNVVERECLRKVIYFLGRHPLRLYHTVMYTDWVFEEVCKEAIEEKNPEKLWSLGITLKSHFNNLSSLCRTTKDSKVFRYVFENKVKKLYDEINVDLETREYLISGVESKSYVNKGFILTYYTLGYGTRSRIPKENIHKIKRVISEIREWLQKKYATEYQVMEDPSEQLNMSYIGNVKILTRFPKKSGLQYYYPQYSSTHLTRLTRYIFNAMAEKYSESSSTVVMYEARTSMGGEENGHDRKFHQ